MASDDLESRSRDELIGVIQQQQTRIAELQTQIAQLRLLATKKNGADQDALDAAAQAAPAGRLPLAWRVILIVAGLFSCAVVLIIGSFRPPSPVGVGRAADFQPGTVRAAQLPSPNRADPAIPVYLVGEAGGSLLALYRQDPFSGCLVEWQAARQRFEDPCSPSAYHLSGELIEGPAPRGLDRFAVSVTADGEVSVDATARQAGPPRP